MLGQDPTHDDEDSLPAPTFTRIARLPPQDIPNLLEKIQAQVILLDLYQRVGPLEQHVAEQSGGLWLRHASPLDVGTRVVVHVVLPEQFYPVTLEGIVAKIRRDAPGHPWMLVWFDETDAEGRMLITRTLKERAAS